MAQTIVSIPTQQVELPFPGVDWTVQQLQSSLASSYPGLASMDSTTTTLASGDKVITFSPRTGTKG